MNGKDKMTDAGRRILAGLEEVAEISEGTRKPVKVHRIRVPAIDVAKVRSATGLTQTTFANSIGVSTGTLRNWEQGRRKPEGPAQVLLALVAKEPALIQEILGVPVPKKRTGRKPTRKKPVSV